MFPEVIMKISEVFQFLAIVYSNISQAEKKLELSNISMSKVMAPRKNALLPHGRYASCAHHRNDAKSDYLTRKKTNNKGMPKAFGNTQ
jgi:hypothetical protein